MIATHPSVRDAIHRVSTEGLFVAFFFQVGINKVLGDYSWLFPSCQFANLDYLLSNSD